ncbi:uncharacterized protein M6B38_163935 [Iris pallida]|uniref:Uncharacterized protein n=1 Tax=Iris pallida TaxID=29817 RepID=A0AAX6EYI6_IRIPA|nr:uncharacterized protein M6B38_163935 [Iris pallida]
MIGASGCGTASCLRSCPQFYGRYTHASSLPSTLHRTSGARTAPQPIISLNAVPAGTAGPYRIRLPPRWGRTYSAWKTRSHSHRPSYLLASSW